MNAPLAPWLIVTGNPADGFRHYGPFAHAEDAGDYAERSHPNEEWWIVPIHSVGGAIGRAERFVASGGDTEVLLEGLPEGESYDSAKIDWRYEVANGDTLLGFLDWMDHQAEAERISPTEDESRGHH